VSHFVASEAALETGAAVVARKRPNRRLAALKASASSRRLLGTTSMAALGLALATSTPSRATDWTGGTSTDWFTAGNWSAGVPTNADLANIDTVAPNATVVGATGAQADFLFVGNSGIGTLTIQNGGAVSNVTGILGVSAISTGTATVDGAGSSWTKSGGLDVGGSGTGTLTIQNGGNVSNADGSIGRSAGSTGTATVDGAGSAWTNSGTLFVGNSGIGTLTIQNGAAVSAASGMQIANQVGSTGTLNIGAASGQAAAAPGTLTTPSVAFGAGTGRIVFNHTASNYTFAPTISGAGSVTVENGTTILTATNTYSGPTTVNGGTLTVNGSTATSSLTTVNTGGTLNGTGTVGNTTITGGTFTPGNGTPASSMMVNGNLVFQSAAFFMVQVNPTTASFANVTGNATLGDATVKANFAAGTYVAKQYTIVQATGTVGGAFDPAVVNTNLPSNFHTTLSYDAHDAFLNLALNFAVPGGLNGNQAAVGNALTNFFNTTGSIPIVFGALTPAGLTQISGETAVGSQQTTFNAMGQFLGLLTDPFIDGRGDGVSAGGSTATGYASTQKTGAARDAYAMFTKAPVTTFDQRWSVWASGFGGSQTTNGNTTLGSNTATSRIYGMAAGADYRFSPDTIAGFALAGGGTNFNVANSGSGRSDLFQAGAFIKHNVGAAYFSGALAYGWQDITTNRTVTVAGLDQLRAEFNANAFSGRVEGGYRLVAPVMGGIGITPYAAGQFTSFDLPAYAEQAVTGANTFALAYGSRSVTDTRSELGLRSDKSYAMLDGILTLRGRVAWAHDFNPDRNIGATFQTLPGASFVVGGAAQASDSALVTASVEKKWLNGWSAAATFEGEFSNVTRSYAGKGVVRYAW
jgi:T5SS/PEP-CTERM-associated repeat protein